MWLGFRCKNLYKKKLIFTIFIIKVDIDSSVLILDKDGNLIDKVYYNNLKSKDWAVIHRGYYK